MCEKQRGAYTNFGKGFSNTSQQNTEKTKQKVTQTKKDQASAHCKHKINISSLSL